MKLTIEKFLADGCLFKAGDIYLDRNSNETVVGPSTPFAVANIKTYGDDKRFVIKARCLMLPKHFRLYHTPEHQKNAGELIVLNKDSGNYLYAHVKDLPRAIKKLGKVCWGGSFDRQNFHTLKPIISFAQLKN